LDGVYPGWQSVFLLVIKAAEARPSILNEPPKLRLQSGSVTKTQVNGRLSGFWKSIPG